MSGRAGRRGKDERGIVIQMLDEKMEPEIAKNMIYGASDPLHSSYHVSYNMLLNMLRVEDANPENIIVSSFHQFQQEKNAPFLEEEAKNLFDEASRIVIDNEEIVSEYLSLKKLYKNTINEIISIKMNPIICLPFLLPGRLIKLVSSDFDWGWGIVVSIRKINLQQNLSTIAEKFIQNNDVVNKKSDNNKEYIIEVLLDFHENNNNNNNNLDIKNKLSILPCIIDNNNKEISKKNKNSKFDLVYATLSSIAAISSVRLTVDKKFQTEESRKKVKSVLDEVKRRFISDGLPEISNVDLGIEANTIQNLVEREADIKKRIKESSFNDFENKEDLHEQFLIKEKILESANETRKKARELLSIAMKDELKRMRRVLRRLEYISADGVLSTKGRFSCELSTADELVLTNMIFDGVFNELSIDQAVALLSCFVFNEPIKEEGATKLRGDMQPSFRQLQAIARNVAKVSIDAKLTVDEEEYVNSFNPGMIDITFRWSAGAKFHEICKLTEIFEGSIIRVLRRLEELLRQLSSAALAIGNTELMQLFEQGSTKIRRGVVFTASLYI